MRRILLSGVFAVATLMPAAPSLAQPHRDRSCFYVNDWHGWKAADDRTLFLNVSGNRVFQLDLASPCPEIQLGSSRIVSVQRGSSGLICTALDLDVHVSQGDHIATSCIVRDMHELTPSEIAALPRHLRP